jgi:hypothetical protein
MWDAPVEYDGDDEDPGDWSPTAAAIAASTASRPATRIQRMRTRRVVDRAGWP